MLSGYCRCLIRVAQDVNYNHKAVRERFEVEVFSVVTPCSVDYTASQSEDLDLKHHHRERLKTLKKNCEFCLKLHFILSNNTRFSFYSYGLCNRNLIGSTDMERKV